MASNIVKTALSWYNVATVKSVKQLSGGVENANYRINCSDNDYVLRIYNQVHSIRGKRSIGSIEEELRFVIACRGVVPVASPIANRQGRFATELSDDGFCALFAFVTGTPVEAINESVVKAYAMILDGLYDVSLHFEVSDRTFRHDIISRALAATMACQTDIGEVSEIVKRLTDKINASKPVRNSLPAGEVHGDIKLANTLFENCKLTALLDFDDCRYSYLLEDTVMTIMHNLDQPDRNILRAGYLDTLTTSITNPKLLQDMRTSLRTLIQARLLYDICKYAKKDITTLHQILADPNIAPFLAK